MATEQYIGPNGQLINETGDFEAMTPFGTFLDETISTTSGGAAYYYHMQQ